MISVQSREGRRAVPDGESLHLVHDARIAGEGLAEEAGRFFSMVLTSLLRVVRADHQDSCPVPLLESGHPSRSSGSPHTKHTVQALVPLQFTVYFTCNFTVYFTCEFSVYFTCVGRLTAMPPEYLAWLPTLIGGLP